MATNSVMRKEVDFQSRYALLMILHFANLTLTRHLDLVDGKPQRIQEFYESRLNSGFRLSKLCYPIFSLSVAIESTYGSPFCSRLLMMRPVFHDSLFKAIVNHFSLHWYILCIAPSCPAILVSSTGLSTESDSVQNIAVGPPYLRDLDSLITGHNKLKVFSDHWCPTLEPEADDKLAACEILRVFVIPLIGECRHHTPSVNLCSEAVIPLAVEDIFCLI